MPKSKLIETRRDFSGGLNIVAPPDALNDNELLICANARVEPFGGIMRRPGSVLLTTSPINSGGTLSGMFQWAPDNAPQQIIAVNPETGSLYFSNSPFTSFTEFAANVTYVPSFATFRDTTAGAPLVLFIAAGNGILKWDGTTATVVTLPAAHNPLVIRAFGGRLFTNSLLYPKQLFWSALGDGSNWVVGGLTGAGSSMIDVLTGDSLVDLEVTGSSLLLCTNEAIARFTGTGDDIRILQDTQGVSIAIGPNTVPGEGHATIQTEAGIFLHSERGPYYATEGGVAGIGKKVTSPNQSTLRMSMTTINNFGWQLRPLVGHNARRNEVWYAYCPIGGSRRDRVLVYNYLLQCWQGPFEYANGITCFGEFEGADGIESIMAGFDDGHIRLLDSLDGNGLDDGLTDFDSLVEFAPLGIVNGPFTQKTLRSVYITVVGEHSFTLTAVGELGTTDEGAFVE